MRVMVVLAHPSAESLNAAIAQRALQALTRGGHEIYFHDLCREGFDPLLQGREMRKDAHLTPSVDEHCAELRVSDGLIVVHPNWWGMPPAVLKGWIDRVIRPGVAYEFTDGDSGEGVPVGLLAGKTGLVFNTSDTPDARERGVFGDPLERIWKDCIFGFCGITDFHRKVFNVVVTSTPAQRAGWLDEVEATVNACFPPVGGGN
ncbi:MAG: flavodoxin family protein [Spirochaetes bacterium]|nr:MAG: flavodoxin family protein [Spirochaetota bacterium]